MSGRKHLSTAKINQVIDETIWKEKIAHERRAKEYWDNIYRHDTEEQKVSKFSLSIHNRNYIYKVI